MEEVADPGGAFDAAIALAAKVAAQPPLSVTMTKLTVPTQAAVQRTLSANQLGGIA